VAEDIITSIIWFDETESSFIPLECDTGESLSAFTTTTTTT
jgi:hypothetical protein